MAKAGWLAESCGGGRWRYRRIGWQLALLKLAKENLALQPCEEKTKYEE
jgi:hypothetical protein